MFFLEPQAWKQKYYFFTFLTKFYLFIYLIIYLFVYLVLRRSATCGATRTQCFFILDIKYHFICGKSNLY